jgi:UDP-glucose 4-epimerase
VISVFVQRLFAGQPLVIFGDGLQSRDFVYVADVVDANLHAATAEGASGHAYNVARGERTSLLQLAEMLGRITGSTGGPTLAPERAGDIRHSQASIDRARQELRYAPRVDLEAGLAALVDHQRARRAHR